MLCSDCGALRSSPRAFWYLNISGRPLKSLHPGAPGRQIACAHLSKHKTASHDVSSSPKRRAHVCAAFPACTGQGVSLLFSASTAYCVPFFAMMLFLPNKRVTVSTMHSNWIFVPLSIMYIALLIQSWTPETLQMIMPGSLQAGLAGKFNPQFFPKLEGIQFLFSQTITAASLWVHLLSINLFAARTAYLQGLHDQFVSFHSVFLSMFFGPLGLLSHLITQAVCAHKQQAAVKVDAAVNVTA
ncbi:TPA: hypothetical protein ACH3X2_009532 [Trebouxia sp. C0005]